MIGIPMGLLYANAVEWLVHRYVLHGPGKNPRSFWRFHWAEHHKNSRKNGMYDADYEKSLFDWNARGKEAFGIALMGAAQVPGPEVRLKRWSCPCPNAAIAFLRGVVTKTREF